MKDIAEWLASLDLGEYAQRFAENAIDLSVISDLTENDLEKLGVLLGHRRKMLRAIAELQGEAASKSQTSAGGVIGRVSPTGTYCQSLPIGSLELDNVLAIALRARRS
jgi:hypothetical protein